MDHSGLPRNQIFPSKASFLIFITYISLFVSQGLLVTAVQRSQIYGFNAIVVILLTELVKLLICVTLYIIRSQGDIFILIHDLRKNNRLLLLYLVPAILYCLYNNLTFINLELFDLTTYYCLMQFRVVLTAIIYQVLFRRQLTLLQWGSLIILTLGCLLKEYGLYHNFSNQDAKLPLNETHLADNSTTIASVVKESKIELNSFINFIWLTSLLLLQMFCSCFAGVYNEYLLKDSSTANNAGVILQNIFMYLDSIFCNFIIYLLVDDTKTNQSNASTEVSVFTILHNLLTNPLVILLILNNAFSGLTASFFLKSLNSILKTFASALELFVVAILAWIIFDNRIDSYTLAALVLVSVAMIVYSRNPVSVAPPSRTNESKDGFILVSQIED